MSDGWEDPFERDDAAAHDRERRRAERESRRREREQSRRASLADRVREEIDRPAATEDRPPATEDRPPATEASAPAPQPEAPASQVQPPARPSPGAVRRRRAAAVVGLACLAFAVFVVVVVAGRLGSGDAQQVQVRKVVSVTIPEGYSRDQVAEVTADAGVRGDYAQASAQTKLLDPRYGADGAESLEGFLFPATYEVFRDAGAEALVRDQLAAFEERFRGIDLGYARSKNLTPYDIVIIASMIEREVQVPSERAKVAAVIYNRLSAGIPLGIDATIRFEDGNYDEQLTAERLEEDTPYNTRTNVGLPPGPIGSPGEDALAAAADPAPVDYLYFVVKPGTCGEHFFTASEAEFNQAVAEYQAALEAEGGSPTRCPG